MVSVITLESFPFADELGNNPRKTASMRRFPWANSGHPDIDFNEEISIDTVLTHLVMPYYHGRNPAHERQLADDRCLGSTLVQLFGILILIENILQIQSQ